MSIHSRVEDRRAGGYGYATVAAGKYSVSQYVQEKLSQLSAGILGRREGWLSSPSCYEGSLARSCA